MATDGLPNYPKIILELHDSVRGLKHEYEEQLIPISDDNPLLHRFSLKIEYLLLYDLKEKISLFGKKKSYWDYLNKCLTSERNSHDGLRFVQRLNELQTPEGRGRAFIRFCLMHQCLADSLQQCLMNEKLTKEWYGENSPFSSAENVAFLLSSLYELNDCQFDLSPHDQDLDVTWPISKKTSGTNYSWKPPSRSISFSSLASSQNESSSLMNCESDEASVFAPSSLSTATQNSDDKFFLPEMNQSDNALKENLERRCEQLQEENRDIHEKYNLREKYFLEQIEKLKSELHLSHKTVNDISSNVLDANIVNFDNCRGKSYDDTLSLISENLMSLECDLREISPDSQCHSLLSKIVDLIVSIKKAVLHVIQVKKQSAINLESAVDENDNLRRQVLGLEADKTELCQQVSTLRTQFKVCRSHDELNVQVNALKDALAAAKEIISLKDMKIEALKKEAKNQPVKMTSEAPIKLSENVAGAASTSKDKYSIDIILNELVQELFSRLKNSETETSLLTNIVRVATELHTKLDEQIACKEKCVIDSEKQMRIMNEKLSKMFLLIDEQQKQVESLKSNLDLSQQENKKLIQQMKTLNDLLQQAEKTDLLLSQNKTANENTNTSTSQNAASSSRTDDLSDVKDFSVALSEGKKEKPTSESNEAVDQPVIVVKVNRTLSKLHSLIEEKNELQQELESTKVITSTLLSKVAEQERQLSTVTTELTATQELVSRMKSVFSSLQTNESILRYELREKRHLLNKLKVQLESSRAQWKQVCQKNSESQIEWQSLRDEFAKRHKQGSEESGFSDECTKAETRPSDASAQEKIVNAPPVATNISEIVSPDDASNLSDRCLLEDDEIDVRDQRLKFLEEQCRLLRCKLLNSAKYGEALDLRLTSLLDHHGSGETEDNATTPDEQETSEASEIDPISTEGLLSDESGLESQTSPACDGEKEVMISPFIDPHLKITPLPVECEPMEELILNEEAPVEKPSAIALAHALPKRIEKLRREKESLKAELDKLKDGLHLSEAREVHLSAQNHLLEIEKDETLKKLNTAHQNIAELSRKENVTKMPNDNSRFEEVMMAKQTLETKLEKIAEQLQGKSVIMRKMEDELQHSEQKLVKAQKTFEQEISTLQCQMNGQSHKYQQILQENQEKEAHVLAMTNQINQQDITISYLETELGRVKDSYEGEKETLWNQLENVKQLLLNKNDENSFLREDLKQKMEELEEMKLLLHKKVEMEAVVSSKEEKNSNLEMEMKRLQAENEELKNQVKQLSK